MSLTGSCFITYDGKKHVGRPQNTFKKALESSQKAFLGQVRVIRNSENGSFGLEILRKGEVLLKTSNIHHIIPTFKGEAVEFKFFGNKVPRDIEFGDKKALTGFQMDSQHFVTVIIHMHFCQCNDCLLKKQAEKSSLVEELEEKLGTEKQRIEQLESELTAVRDIYEAETGSLKENLTTLNQSQKDLEAVIAKQQRDLENLKEQLDRQNQRNEELQRKNNREIQEKNAEIQRLNQLVRQLEQVQQYVQPQRYEEVFITKTGDCYHTHTGCPGLSRANNVWPEKKFHVQGRLRECMRCH
uniref:Uncharacterized protein n=1 Tax=Panagrolaimus davidi TaxID=227884 RepID=A0A914PG98_9BILA